MSFKETSGGGMPIPCMIKRKTTCIELIVLLDELFAFNDSANTIQIIKGYGLRE